MRPIEQAPTEDVLRKLHLEWWWVKPLPEDLALIAATGKARNNNGKSHGMKSRTSDESNTWHEAGFAGEWAVGLMLNLPVHANLARSRAKLNEGDLLGWIEVKTNRKLERERMGLVCNEDHLMEGEVNGTSSKDPAAIFLQGCRWVKDVRSQRERSWLSARRYCRSEGVGPRLRARIHLSLEELQGRLRPSDRRNPSCLQPLTEGVPMTPPSRKKARPVRKPRDLHFLQTDTYDYKSVKLVSGNGGWAIYDEEAARMAHAWLGKWLAWRADQERRKK